MDLQSLSTILNEHGLAVTLVVAGMGWLLWYYWPSRVKRDDDQAKRTNEREDTLLKRAFESADAQISLTKELAKNMAEGNFILTTLSHHVTENSKATENIVKRLEIADAKIEERHMANMANNAKMFAMWEEIRDAVLQNAGDSRQIVQKYESSQRQKKKAPIPA